MVCDKSVPKPSSKDYIQIQKINDILASFSYDIVVYRRKYSKVIPVIALDG